LAQALSNLRCITGKESSSILLFTLKLKAMKTNNLKQYFPVLICTVFLTTATIGVSAENHRGEGKRDREKGKREYSRNDRDDDRSSYYYRDYDRDNRSYQAKYHKRYRSNQPDYFEHPQYGRVYQRFDRNPVVFRHNHDDYYYYGNHFYTYRRGVGYCVVEEPRNVYFRTLPVECERVYIGGHVYFRNGDLFFQLSPRGYVMTTIPAGIHITARF